MCQLGLTPTNLASNFREKCTAAMKKAGKCKTKRNEYICGAKNSSCGSKRPKKGASSRSCPVNGKNKKVSRAIAPVLTRRTLIDVDDPNKYVVAQVIQHEASELDYTYPTGHVYAVSKYGTWTNRPQSIPLTGLEGCTGVAVVSEKGYWIGHFMELAMDTKQSDHETMWDHLLRDVTNGRQGKYTPPHDVQGIFEAVTKPQIYISRPQRDGKMLHTSFINKILGQIQKGQLKNAPVARDFHYHKMTPKEVKLSNENAAGKMLIEYTNDQEVNGQTQSPQQAMYRIWLENHPFPVSWAALANQRGETAQGAGNNAIRDEFTNHCLSDPSRSIPKADRDDIVAAICKGNLNRKLKLATISDKH